MPDTVQVLRFADGRPTFVEEPSSSVTALPLSIGQERIYQLASLSPDAPLYNISAAYRIYGPLDVDALRLAVREIEQEQPVLRTVFRGSGQAVPLSFCLPHASPTTFAYAEIGAASREAVDGLVDAAAAEQFDLSSGPLWRLKLFRIMPEEHVLVLTMHHIITDAWSFGLFLNRLGRLYPARRGDDAAEPRPPQTYAEFSQRQREYLATEACERQRDHWRDRFAQKPPALVLPGLAVSDAFAKRDAASVSIELPPALSKSLFAFSHSRQATLFMTLLAAFAGLLRAATGQEDLVICMPVAGRHRAQTRSLIGYFNNILPVRLDASGDPTLAQMVGRCRETALNAYRDQDIPFQWIAALPQLHNAPLSRMLFSFDTVWPPGLDLEGLRAVPRPAETGAADFDLAVSMWLKDGQIFGSLRYKTHSFVPGAVEELGRAYVELIEALAADPDGVMSAHAKRAADTHHLAVEYRNPGSPPSAEALVLPRTALEMQLVREWEETFERSPIGIEDTLQSLGVTSMAVVELAERVRCRFAADIPVETIFRTPTIKQMAAIIQHATEVPASPLAPIQPHGAKPPLFLCEGVGIYYPLVKYLGDDRPVYGLISEVAINHPDVADLAAHYVKAALEVQDSGPFHLGGVSFGGLVAFEMAQQLQTLGHQVGVLALFDTPGPSAFKPHAMARRLWGHGRNFARYRLPYARSKISRFGEKGRGRRRAAGQVDDPVDIRAAFQASASTYRIQPYRGIITLFMLAQRDALSDSLFDPMLGTIDPYLGWDAVAPGGVARHLVGGEHVTMLREPFVETVGLQLRRMLDGADEGRC